MCAAVPARILKTVENSKETASHGILSTLPTRTTIVVAAIPATTVPLATTVPASFGGHEVKNTKVITQNVGPVLQLRQEIREPPVI